MLNVKNSFWIIIGSFYIILKIRERAHLVWLNLLLKIKPAWSKSEINIELLTALLF